MENRILALLSENARMSLAEMAARLETTPEAVREAIQSLEKRGVIRGYKVILNESELDSDKVKALIEARAKARAEKNWAESDRLRDEITALGYVLKDTKQGQQVTKAL